MVLWLTGTIASGLLFRTYPSILFGPQCLLRLNSRTRFTVDCRNRFQRSDYPKRDDENWLKHILIKKTHTGMSLSTIPVEFPYVKMELKK